MMLALAMLIFHRRRPAQHRRRDVMAVYRGQRLNRYAEVTLVMANGEEGCMMRGLERLSHDVSR
jgi:hypothetical protein